MKIPFYPNHENGMYCVLAVYKSLYEYFFDEKLSFEQLAKMARADGLKGIWHLALDIDLAKKGIEIISIEDIDAEKLFEKKEKYLEEIYDKQTSNYYIKNSNITSLWDLIPEYEKSVNREIRKPKLNDIDGLFNKGYIVTAEINSAILNNDPGFYLHYILITGKEGYNYFINDPGLPPVENRKVSEEDLRKALANEVSGFKLK